MRSAMERGKWVFFQNCHLAPSFMPSLERMIEQIDPDKVSSAHSMHSICLGIPRMRVPVSLRLLCHRFTGTSVFG